MEKITRRQGRSYSQRSLIITDSVTVRVNVQRNLYKDLYLCLRTLLFVLGLFLPQGRCVLALKRCIFVFMFYIATGVRFGFCSHHCDTNLQIKETDPEVLSTGLLQKPPAAKTSPTQVPTLLCVKCSSIVNL